MTLADLDFALMLGGLFSGVMVGLTGMGGAALITPMLVLVFNVPAAAAVSSDVLASAIMKPVGAAVHIRSRTVHWGLVGWLSAGSVPGVLIGTWIFSRTLQTSDADATIRLWIGIVLILALVAMGVRTFVHQRAERIRGARPPLGTDMPVSPLPSILIGAVVGLLVGMTSVGSGALVATGLLLLYPLLRTSVLVGTDLTQAVPMLVVGAIAHAGVGDIDAAIVISLLIGQIPGVLVGARLSSRYDGHALRWLLMVVLAATALRLLGAPTILAAGVALIGMVVVVALILRERARRDEGQRANEDGSAHAP